MEHRRTREVDRILKDAARENLQLTLRGDCMAPCLLTDTKITISRSRFYWPGDVLVYRDRQNQLLAHRLLGYYRRKGKWKCLIQADNGRRPDPGTDASQIIGRVISERPRLRHRLVAIRRYASFALIVRYTR